LTLNARTMNLGLRLCATSACLLMLLLTDSHTDMLILHNSWMWKMWAALSNHGLNHLMRNRKWDSFMGITLKTQIIREELELLLKQFMSHPKLVIFLDLTFYKILMRPKSTLLLSHCLWRKLDGYSQPSIMTHSYLLMKSEWLRSSKKSIEFFMNQDILFLRSSQLY